MDLREVAEILRQDLNWIPFDSDGDPNEVTFYSIPGHGGPYPEGGRHLVARLYLEPRLQVLSMEFEGEREDSEYISGLDEQDVADLVIAAFIDHLSEGDSVRWNAPPIDLEERPGTYLGQHFGGYYGRVPWGF